MCDSQGTNDPTTYDTPRPSCQRLVFVRGQDRRCAQTVGVTTWTDHVGGTHHACANHVEGMKRRWPEALSESLPKHGRLRLSTPWARGAFGPNDVIEVENATPVGWTIGVSVTANRANVILWAVDPEGTEQARWMHHKLANAVGAALELARHIRVLSGDPPIPDDWFQDEERYVRAPLSYENREGQPEFNGAFSKW